MMIRSAAWLPLICAVLQTGIVHATETDPVAGVDSIHAQRQTIAVVLGGGGAHAVAHLGILQELERQRVPIDLIVGTVASMHPA